MRLLALVVFVVALLVAPGALAAAPANDDFSNALDLFVVGTPYDTVYGRYAEGTNVEATAETGEPDHAGESDPVRSAWWTFVAPGDGTATVNTCGSGYDTTLGVYTSDPMTPAVDNLTEVASNDDGPTFFCDNDLASSVTFDAVGGTTYYIAVAGVGGDTGNVFLNAFAGVETRITSSPFAPGTEAHERTATFGFGSQTSAGLVTSGRTYQCSLDGAAFAACSSPQSYSDLADGGHTFEVMDDQDADPVFFDWTVKGPSPSAPPVQNALPPPPPVTATAALAGAASETDVVGRGWVVRLHARLDCRGSQVSCSYFDTAKTNGHKVGGGSGTVPAGSTQRILLRLNARGRKPLKHHHRLKTRVRVKYPSGLGPDQTRTLNVTIKPRPVRRPRR